MRITTTHRVLAAAAVYAFLLYASWYAGTHW